MAADTPPKECLRLAVRVLRAERTDLAENAEYNRDNLSGYKTEHQQKILQGANIAERKARRLDRVIAWMEGML